MSLPDFSSIRFTEHPQNPLLEPPWPEWILADPTVAHPGQSPDGLWHLIAHTLVSLQHYTSVDGLEWKRESSLFNGLRPHLFHEDGLWFLTYEKLEPPLGGSIEMRTSTDLFEWSAPRTILRPTLDWHGSVLKRVGNPCLLKVKDEYRLYYSAGHVLLRDCAFTEPVYVGLARAADPNGPFEPDEEPQLGPGPDDPHRNLGAGAIKVLHDKRRRLFWGFNNGIWTDEEGKSRSAILLLKSKDGVAWEDAVEQPLLGPGGKGWKKALVYALDITVYDGKAWLYFNARDGWLFGRERLGLAWGE